MSTEPAFTCPRCAMTSHNAHDIHEGYCGNCHDWTGAIPELAGVGGGGLQHVDRQGNEVSLGRHLYLLAHDSVLAQDDLSDGIAISTVWFGMPFLDDGFEFWARSLVIRAKVVFETAVFLDGKLVALERYSTEDEAMATHTTLKRSLEMVGREFLTEVSAWPTPTPSPQETPTS